jgi:hypothetical protein
MKSKPTGIIDRIQTAKSAQIPGLLKELSEYPYASEKTKRRGTKKAAERMQDLAEERAASAAR